MDTESVARSPRTDTPEAELAEAIRDDEALLGRTHAPGEREAFATGFSEGRETRPCRSCRATGWTMLDASYDPATGELTEESAPCPICSGRGVTNVYLYATPRSH